MSCVTIAVLGSVTAKQYQFIRLSCLRLGMKLHVARFSLDQLQRLIGSYRELYDQLVGMRDDVPRDMVNSFFGGMSEEEICHWFLHDQAPGLAPAEIKVFRSSEVDVNRFPEVLWEGIADIEVDLDAMEGVEFDYLWQNLQGLARHKRGEYPMIVRG